MRRWPGLVLAGLAIAAGPVWAAPLTELGRGAYDSARQADDAAGLALDDGERSASRLRALAPERDPPSEALKALLDEGEGARQALVNYRRLAQASSLDALRLLADVARIPVVPAPDLVRRDTLEQHALLAAREASVMAARARAEAERLRAVLAEARLVGAPGSPARRGGGSAPRAAPEAPSDTARPGETPVPNLIGARLDAATRDLEAAGLRLGVVTGPRDGFVIKQSPEAGATTAARAPVSVTLSGTAVGSSP